MTAIFKRQSVRKFSDKEISNKQIEMILKAGMQAPSACNQQSWEFIIIGDERDKIAISHFHKFAKPAREASKLIVVLGNLGDCKIESMIEQDLGACCENMLIQAVEEGLGAVWLGFHPIADRCAKLKNYLNIPDGYIPFAVICVGYPAYENKVKIRYDENKVHYDRF